MKFTKRQQGVISVFLSIILLMMFIFSAVIVDGSRIFAAKNIVSGAGQLALNSGLATYDEALKDAYGLIAMSDDVDDLNANLNEYFIASLGTCGISEEDYNTALVFLQMAAEDSTVHAKAVPNTEVCRGYVMEQQVLDYMKYRAPITIGTGILNKLMKTKDMKKYQKVANDEVKTNKDANDVQKHLEKLEETVDEEKKIYDYFNGVFSSVLDNMKKDAQAVTAGRILIQNYSKLQANACGGDWEEVITNFQNTFANIQVALANGNKVLAYTNAYNYFMEIKPYYLEMQNVTQSQFEDFWCEKYSIVVPEPLSGEKMSKSDKEMLKMGTDLFKEFKADKKAFDTLLNSTIPSDLNNKLKSIQENAKRMYDQAKEGEKLNESIDKRIDKIQNKMEDLEKSLVQWEKDTKALPDADIRAKNKEKQDQYWDLIKSDTGIGELEKASKKNKEFYEAFKLYIEKAEFALVDIRSVYNRSSSVQNEIASKGGGIRSGSELKTYVESDNFRYLYSMYNVKDVFNFKTVKDLTKLDFYEYLEEACGKKKKKEDIKSANGKLSTVLTGTIEAMNQLMTSNDLKNYADLGKQSGHLPTTLMKTSANQSGLKDDKGVDKNKEIDIDSSGKRGDMLDSATDTLNNDNTMLDNITSIGDKVKNGIGGCVESVYITEYFMTMYSYYTIDKDGTKEGEKWKTKDKKDLVSLSNFDLTQDVIYRAEVEYILWGNQMDSRKNVNKTKAVIFAIQFIGNLTYALTQDEVTAGAEFIAGFFPNKLVSLVVEVVVEIVVATVETVRDLNVLCNGGSVVLFKTMSTVGGTTPASEWRSDFKTPADITKWDMTKDQTTKNSIAFSYRDYLWVMLCVNCESSSKRYTMLERAADLAQVNVAKSKGMKDSSKYLLTKKNTMLQIDANVQMDTWFVTDIFNKDDSLGLDTSGKYTLKYKGIQGY